MATIYETNFELPGQASEVYHGKVGDTYTIDHDAGELLVVVRSDRISAFDVILPETIPFKGQVLNQMSANLLGATKDVAPNWLINSPDPNVSIGYKADPFKVEMIMRRYLLGSSWDAYSIDGVRDICGNVIPDGMFKFQPFDHALLTPTTKATEGHDINITPAEIFAQGLATEAEYDEMARLSFALFGKGQTMANERGLLLADTKYEFGRLATGQIVVIDEVHTPDSSRYFPKDTYEAYLKGDTEETPQQLSKEFVREWLKSKGFKGEPGQVPPPMSEEFRGEVSNLYIDLFERMLGREFEPATEQTEDDVEERILMNVIHRLGNLSLT